MHEDPTFFKSLPKNSCKNKIWTWTFPRLPSAHHLLMDQRFLGRTASCPNLLETNPGIRELKHLLIGFLSSYFNLLAFFWTAL